MNIEDFKNGWLVGDFEPALVKTKDVEVGLLKLSAGHLSDAHYHKLHDEFNFLVSGKIRVNGKPLSEGEIFVYKPYERSDVFCLEDSVLLVIKSPATKNDKYY